MGILGGLAKSTEHPSQWRFACDTILALQRRGPRTLDLHVAKLLAFADPSSPSKGDVGPLVLHSCQGLELL